MNINRAIYTIQHKKLMKKMHLKGIKMKFSKIGYLINFRN